MSRKFIFSIFLIALIFALGLFANLHNALFSPKLFAIEPEDGSAQEEAEQIHTLDEDKSAKSDKVNSEFILSIPAISLRKDVMRNIDPSNKDEYMAVLRNSIAHGKYTLLPDQAVDFGNVYLFAHRQGTFDGKDIGFFRRLNEIRFGDEAYINFDGSTYIYKFRSSKIVSPKDTYVYTSYSPTPTLTLQTCEQGFSKRLILTFDFIGRY